MHHTHTLCIVYTRFYTYSSSGFHIILGRFHLFCLQQHIATRNVQYFVIFVISYYSYIWRRIYNAYNDSIYIYYLCKTTCTSKTSWSCCATCVISLSLYTKLSLHENSTASNKLSKSKEGRKGGRGSVVCVCMCVGVCVYVGSHYIHLPYTNHYNHHTYKTTSTSTKHDELQCAVSVRPREPW